MIHILHSFINALQLQMFSNKIIILLKPSWFEYAQLWVPEVQPSLFRKIFSFSWTWACQSLKSNNPFLIGIRVHRLVAKSLIHGHWNGFSQWQVERTQCTNCIIWAKSDILGRDMLRLSQVTVIFTLFLIIVDFFLSSSCFLSRSLSCEIFKIWSRRQTFDGSSWITRTFFRSSQW